MSFISNPRVSEDIFSTLFFIYSENLKIFYGNDAWVECDGIQTCTRGKFAGEVCCYLTDRVLVGAGKTGSLLEVRDASLPDHAHSGTKSYDITYRTGPRTLGTGKQYMCCEGSLIKDSLSDKHGRKYQ